MPIMNLVEIVLLGAFFRRNTMEKIKVIRYSNTGFKPRQQIQMRKFYDYYVNFNEAFLPEGITDYVKRLIVDTALKTKEVLEHDFSFNGIHVFIDRNADKETIRFQLNHIKGPIPTRHETYMNAEIPCRALSDPFLLTSRICSLKEALEKGHCGVFIEGKYL